MEEDQEEMSRIILKRITALASGLTAMLLIILGFLLLKSFMSYIYIAPV